MIHRIASSAEYRDSPTAIRCRWALRDFIATHVLLDIYDEARERERMEADRGK